MVLNYGIVDGEGWGYAPESIRELWKHKKCHLDKSVHEKTCKKGKLI